MIASKQNADANHINGSSWTTRMILVTDVTNNCTSCAWTTYFNFTSAWKLNSITLNAWKITLKAIIAISVFVRRSLFVKNNVIKIISNKNNLESIRLIANNQNTGIKIKSGSNGVNIGTSGNIFIGHNEPDKDYDNTNISNIKLINKITCNFHQTW
mgnify:CR=1 FL=1